VKSGWVGSKTRIDEFESAVRTVCEPIFEKPLNEISFGKTLMRLFQIGRRFHMEVQPQLVLLQKTLLNIEGLGRQLYPELDLWATAKPFFEKWLKTQIGPKALYEKFLEKQPEWTRELPEIPELIYDVLFQMHEKQKQKSPEIKPKPVSKWKYLFFGAGLTFTVIALAFSIWKHTIFKLHLNYDLTASLLAIFCFIVSFLIRET